ncbi:MAG: HAMP domain-containing sensor histidine kinase [bacterium]|nr:HAMP domain-containing sensor histidine kinase [bacterium]
MLFFLFVRDMFLIVSELIWLVGAFLLYGLNSAGYIAITRLATCVWLNLGIFYFAFIMGDSIKTHIMYIGVIWIPLLLFKNQEYIQISISIASSIVCYFLVEFTNIKLMPSYQLTGIINTLYTALIAGITFTLNLSFAYVLTDTVGQTKQKLKETENDLSSSKAVQVQLHDQATFGHVIQGISHELRNPMTSLKLWADLLKKTPEDTALAEKTATVFLKNIDHLSKRTDSMLKYAHVNHSKNTAIAMHTLCADIGLLFSHQAKSKCIELVIQADTPLFVYGNEHDVHSAIRNVTLNALQFTPDHGRITINVSTERYTPMDTEPSSSNGTIDGVKLTITDTGCGIQADQLNLIFEPFVTSKSGRSNAGLGLAEVKKIITKHNGTIHIESKLNIGTTLSIYLPQHIPSGQTQKDLV